MLANETISIRNRLGFIGLGYLGSRMARRLLNARFPMVVYDRDQTKAAEFAHLGADVALNPGSRARQVDIVLSCLPDERCVEVAYLGIGNVLRSAQPGTRMIEMSTISRDASRNLHQSAQQFGMTALDV